MNSKLLLAYLVIFGFILIPQALAVSPSSIFVDIVPASPGPRENVEISLRSFAANLDSVSISWVVNGKNTISGIGKKSFSITTGDSGSSTSVTAQIFLPDGQIDKTIILRPSGTVLLWQANDSHVPPFYRGKALPAVGSSIKIVAMPEIKSGGVMLDPKNMTYSWQKDFKNEPIGSGYGKNYYIFTNDYLDSTNTVSVEAMTVDQQNISSASVNLSTVTPEIFFYRYDPEMGALWERAILSSHIIVGEEVIVAVPYFLSPQNIRRPEVVWRWYLNDNPLQPQGYRSDMMPLQATAGASGQAKLRLEIENIFKIFDFAEKEITIQF
jgi:hypothetical protein